MHNLDGSTVGGIKSFLFGDATHASAQPEIALSYDELSMKRTARLYAFEDIDHIARGHAQRI